ncbi:MAG: TatD family hydrolase, partial [Dehalococcoidia bacterium]
MAANMLVDTHCHLQLPEFDSDREEVLRRARRAGLDAFVVPGTDVETSRAALTLADSQPDIYAAVGVHPHDADSFNGRTMPALRSLANSSRTVAIGEIGLDYYRNLSPPDAQRQVFRHMLDL